jgi:hypothetical protein
VELVVLAVLSQLVIKPTNGFQESIGNQGFQHAVKTKSKNWLFRIWYKLIGK